MSQFTDQIPLIAQQPLTRGMRLDMPYPQGRSAQDYQSGGTQLHAPGLARHLVEAADTFAIHFGAEVIHLLYLSDEPMPAGTRCDLKPRLTGRESALALPQGALATVFLGTVQAIAPVVAVATMYVAGGYVGLNPPSPMSVARLIDTEGKGGRDFGVDPALLAKAIGVESQERRNLNAATNTQALMGAAAGAASASLQARSRLSPVQEARDLKGYDTGRIQAEISELADRYRTNGYNTDQKKEEANLPMQEIKDSQGNILMRGRAESVEHLIAIKMAEAERSNDPNKKVVSLAGAQLDDKTLGRPLKLEGFGFKNVDMRGANLAGAQIKDCKFENCDMESVCLKNAQMNLCSLKNVNMNGFVGDQHTKFSNCGMENVHMAFAEAPQVKFENIRADKLNIQEANFKGSSWSHVHVKDLWGVNARLDGAKLGDFHVSGRESSLDGCKLNNASIHNATFGSPQNGISMRGLQAQNSTWSDVQFNASDLSNADFTRASFTRVDMRNVVTPRGPMEMKEANITGLTAGADAHLTAYKATHSGVTLWPREDFVFRGTAPLERAVQAAISARSEVANIVSADGATEQELEARKAVQLQQQQQMQMKRRQMEAAPSPYNKNKKKDTPW